MIHPFATRARLPGIATGYPLSDGATWAAVIIPEATTNLLTNPSFETGTTGWTAGTDLLVTEAGDELVTEAGDELVAAGDAGLARTTTQQVRGAYSAALTIGTGATAADLTGGGATPTIGTTYALSAHVRAPGGRPVGPTDALAITNGQAGPWARREYVGNGWWRCWVVFQATTADAVGVRVAGAAGETFHLDALQLEAKGYVTTYCDGDEQGLLPFESPAPFRWTGAPHASTATRSAGTRAGGRALNLDRYGLQLISVQGLGAGPVANVATPLGNAPGSVYQTTDQEARTFTLGGRISAPQPGLLARQRGALATALGADLTGQPQPIRLILQKVVDGRAIGDQAYADCSYSGGLEGAETSLYAEDVAIQFQQWQPGLVSVASRAMLLAQGSAGDSAYAHLYGDDGVITAISGLNGAIERNAAIWGPATGRFYLGGSFTAPQTRVLSIDPTTGATAALGSGLSSTVRALVETPRGDIYAGGDGFTISAVTRNLARYSGGAWSLITDASALPGPIYAMAYDAVRNWIWLGVRNTASSRAEVWYYDITGDVVTSPADNAGTGGFVYALAYDARTRLLYVGGSFTNFGGVAAADALAVYDTAVPGIAAPVAVGSAGANDTVWSLTIDAQSRLIAGGEFTTIGGISAPGIARWTGGRWEALDGLTADTITPIVPAVAYDSTRGVLWALGVADPADNPGLIGVNYVLAEWVNGTATVPGSVTGFSINGRAVVPAPGAVLVARDAASSITSGGIVTLTSGATAPTPPTVVFNIAANSTGSTVIQVRNLSSGQRLDLWGAGTLPAGDRVLVDMAAGRIVSQIRGDLSFGFAGATDYRFALLPGSNRVQHLGTIAPSTAAMVWHPRYRSFDDTVPGGL